MPDYDPGMEALVAEMLTVLAPDVDVAPLGYVEQLRVLQNNPGGPVDGQDHGGIVARPTGGWPGTVSRG